MCTCASSAQQHQCALFDIPQSGISWAFFSFNDALVIDSISNTTLYGLIYQLIRVALSSTLKIPLKELAELSFLFQEGAIVRGEL